MLTLSFLTLTTSIYSSPSELSTNVKSTPTSTATKPTRTAINKLKKKKNPAPKRKSLFSKPPNSYPSTVLESLPLESPSTTSDLDSHVHEDEMREKTWRRGLTREKLLGI